MSSKVVQVEAGAFVVALLTEGLYTEAENFIEWCIENLDLDLSSLLEGE